MTIAVDAVFGRLVALGIPDFGAVSRPLISDGNLLRADNRNFGYHHYQTMKTIFAATLIAVILFAIDLQASGSCIDIFDDELSKINPELSERLRRQISVDRELAELSKARSKMMSELGTLMGGDPAMDKTVAQLRVIELYNELDVNGRSRIALEKAAYESNAEIIRLRYVVPSETQRRMQACAADEDETRSRRSNFAVQGFVLVATAELGLPFHRQAPYIDLGEMLPTSDSGN